MHSLSFRFGTVGSPKSTPRSGSVEAIKHMPELGLSALELGWVRSVRVAEKTAVAIKEAAEQHDVLLSVHAPYYINLNADDEEWPKSRKRLMDAARAGHMAGATEIIFHPGSYLNKAPEEALKLSIERLEGCIQELRENDNPVTLRPETMGKSGQLGSLEETLEMAKAIDGVQPCMDFSHLHARRGDGSLNSYDEWMERLELYAKKLGDEALKSMSCHLSGIEYTAKGEKQHLVMAEADFELDELFKALSESGCEGRLLCESPNLEEDAQLFKKTWMEISGESQ